MLKVILTVLGIKRLNDEFRGYDLSTIWGNNNAVKILSNTMLIGVEEWAVLLLADEEAYFRVHVIRQSKLSKQKVISLTGAPPTSVDGEDIDYIKFTTGNGGEYLRAYFNQYVSPNLCGMSLDVTLPSWEFSEGKNVSIGNGFQ